MLESLLGQLWPYLAGLVALIGGFFFARQSGKQAAKNEIAKAQAKARKEAQRVEREIDSLDADGVDSRLAKWVRGKR